MHSKKFILLAVIILLAVAGSIYFKVAWDQNMKSEMNHALTIAKTAEVSFQTDDIKQLEAEAGDIKKNEYHHIKNSLMEFVQINNNVRFAYVYTVKNGKVYMMADSEPETSEDYSPPGQEYTEADQYVFQAFYEDTAMITEPSKDRWGNWVSVLVPLKDRDTGEIIAVFGIDYPTSEWNKNIFTRSFQAVIAFVCLLMLMITIVIILENYRVLKEDKDKLADLNDKLSEQEELFRTVFEQSPLGISFGNYRYKISNTNRKFEEIIGRKREELTDTTWMEITHPDDIQSDLENYLKFKTGENNGYTMQKRYIRPDKSIVWVNMTIAPLKIKNEGHPSHICILEDITEQKKAELSLKESERTYEMLLSNLPGMAYRCSFDRDWTMQFVSEGCYKLTGYRPESLVHNKDIAFNEIIRSEYRNYLWEKWDTILKEKKVFRDEYPITTASGEIKWVFEQGQGVYDKNGEVKVIEGLIIDISDRKQREDEIQYLNYHDVMTGVYNRRYFEEEKVRCDKESMYPLSVIIGDINGLKLYNDALGHAEGDRLIVTMAEILMNCCREEDIIARTGGDEFSILLPRTKKEEAMKIIRQIGAICEKYKHRIMNEVYHISISLGCATKTSEDEPFTAVMKEAEDYMYRHKLLQSKSLHSSIISSMKSTLYAKSQETEEHAQRLIALSKAIGMSMDLSDNQIYELELLSTLHDIGKIGISDTILNKPGKLTEEEWVYMKKHPEIGYRIAMTNPELVSIANYILSHHERWDGNGYPQHLKGEDIPLLSRIISLADSYDAMMSDRPYRKAMTKEAAMDEIKKNMGTQFDPFIAEKFLEILNHNDDFT
ncbi:MAG: domain S-box [Herbinix sp.]|jgi:diguanylate cyclase (GGDEF)-like protein/PAS domain S-box-containing protein|nr:domain S-box [Herbinix sp.]